MYDHKKLQGSYFYKSVRDASDLLEEGSFKKRKFSRGFVKKIQQNENPAALWYRSLNSYSFMDPENFLTTRIVFITPLYGDILRN